jgi:hypothetical protein
LFTFCQLFRVRFLTKSAVARALLFTKSAVARVFTEVFFSRQMLQWHQQMVWQVFEAKMKQLFVEALGLRRNAYCSNLVRLGQPVRQ